MEYISIIMSGLALVAVVLYAATEKKRNQKRNAAIVHYVDAKVAQLEKKVAKLEAGVIPDYEEARKAADAVNDFNKGISSILGFDPYAAYQKEKQKERNGGDMTE